MKLFVLFIGSFNQTPANHKQGYGCPRCGRCGWRYSDWITSASTSKHFDSFKIYIIKCYDENSEEFIKIGKTYRKVKDRFVSNFPYKYEVVKEIIFEDGLECCKYEVELHNKFTDYSYSPSKKFKGSTECFSTEILNKL